MPRADFAAVLALTLLARVATADVADLDQGWSAAERSTWYGATQGSRLIPLDWMLALEQAGQQVSFIDRAHLESYRYLPRDPAENNPLPIGFVVDDTNDEALSVTRLRWKPGQGATEKWVGLNCSACHTAQITYGDHMLRVDGGPTLADFQTFFEAFTKALIETRDDEEKFARFAEKVLGANDGEANRKTLHTELGKLVAFQEDLGAMNHTPLRYGFGRLDAFGFIFNKVSRIANGSRSGGNPSNAPTSYPFIWNVPQHDKVQWNGIAENRAFAGIGDQAFDIGALGRNTGEVIGVFADVQPSKNLLAGFTSSVHVQNLVALEQQLGRLRPPKWPESVLGAIDPQRAARGRALFDEHCVGCHAHLDRRDLSTPIVAQMTRLAGVPEPIGTDPWMACNAFTHSARSGVLEGAPSQYFRGRPLESTAYLSDMLTVSVAGVLWRAKGEVVKTAAASFFGWNRPPKVVPIRGPIRDFLSRTLRRAPPSPSRLDRCLADDSPLLAYKGRPLTGIWATAPYLHNGSVATLYDLLLPPTDRPRSFSVGTREFDPVHVGYQAAPSGDNAFRFEVFDPDGKAIDGNSNLGHDYGNSGLDEADRMALVEYMKGL